MQRRTTLIPLVASLAFALAVPASASPTASPWTKLDPPQQPVYGGWSTMAYDASRAEVVLLGTQSSGFFLHETAIWDGETWTPVDAPEPSLRNAAVMAYDEANENIVLFGGEYGKAALDDTWIFEDGAWQEVHPPTSADATYYQAMAFDPIRGQVLLFGGGAPFSDQTFAWDGTTWIELDPAKSPPARYGAELAYDAQRGRLVLFGGFGRRAHGPGLLGDTWSWDGSTWERERVKASPPGRAFFGMASADGVVTLFGGNGDDSTFLDDTWVLGKRRWKAVSGRGPAALVHQSMAYDEANEETVLFGGIGKSGPRSDTWVYRH